MNTILAFGLPGGSEWFVIILVVLLLFGAKRLPELARGLGKSIREFKKATSEVEDDIREAMKDEPKKSDSANAQDSAKKSDSVASEKSTDETK